MPPFRGSAWIRCAVECLGVLAACVFALACGATAEKLAPESSTWAELRVVRRGVTVAEPTGAPRSPYPRQRLVDGSRIAVAPGGLAWLRLDTGTTLLVRGPAELRQRTQSVELERGRIFVDAAPGTVAEITTPASPLTLGAVRASIEVRPDRTTEAYVLSGEARARDLRAKAGEKLWLDMKAARVLPVLSWDDWTGGLATADQRPEPAPFGVGTVGGRKAGERGTPRFALAIQKLDVRVDIDGDLAHTEMDESFFNPSSDVVEGLYALRVPPGATLERFGVDRDGHVVWGRVKERAAAAAGYESNLREGENPALLEWNAPGVYHARLYPIGPGKTRRVVVRYSEWLGRTGPRGERRLYVYPLAAEGPAESLPHLEELNFRLDLGDAHSTQVRTGMAGVRRGDQIVIRAQDLVPRADLAVELFDEGRRDVGYRAAHRADVEILPKSERAAAEAGAKKEPDYLLVPVPSEAYGPAPLLKGGLDLGIVLDASAATDPASLSIARTATDALITHLGEDDRAVVWVGAEGLRPLSGRFPKLAKLDGAALGELRGALARVERGGATDLGEMLSSAAAALDPARRGAVVYIGDGRPTVGELSLGGLRSRLGRLPRPVRIYALGVGADADLGMLDGLTRSGFARRVEDGFGAARAVLELYEHAEKPAWLGVSVDLGPNVERVYPRDAGAWVADETMLVVGRLVGGKVPRSVKLSGPSGVREHALAVDQLADRGDLARRWGQARLAELMGKDTGPAALVDLGLRQGLITPFTSLYVPTTREVRDEHGPKPAAAKKENADDREGGTGARAKGEEGSMGNPASRATNKRYAVQGPKDSPDPHIARQAAVREAEEYGMIGLTNAGAGDPNAPTAPWGRDTSLGTGGNLRGDEASNAHAERETEGVRAKGDEPVGALGFGSGHGRVGGEHRTSAPVVRMGNVAVTGQLPPEVIQRIVRQNYGRFRLCYEEGLGRNPHLQGSVSVRFEIGTKGLVTDARRSGGDLPDGAVAECVVAAMRGLEFPTPEAGTVTVTYPIRFAPDGSRADRNPVVPPSVTRDLPRVACLCGRGADLPLADRIVLWREELDAVRDSAPGVAAVYERALRACEARTPAERARLLALMLDAMSSIAGRVTLWRWLKDGPGGREQLYRGILARVKTPLEMRELNRTLGLRTVDPGVLSRTIRQARDARERVQKLRRLRMTFPDDLGLGLRLLEAVEDTGDLAGASELGHELAARSDADAAVRTAVGELCLRLAARATTAADRADLTLQARRAFGEMVEFAPTDPVARRRLGDLLRAHGWYAEARRQYETLRDLTPDDATASLLIAAAAEGQGRLEEAVGWTEKGAAAGAPDVAQGPSATARIMAATYLAWGRRDARAGQRADELGRLVARARPFAPLTATAIRATLAWEHPDFHPTLYGNGSGILMPAFSGDPTLGFSEVTLPGRPDAAVEIRIEPDELESAARLGLGATLTVVFDELGATEKVVSIPVRFARGGPCTLKFSLHAGEVSRV